MNIRIAPTLALSGLLALAAPAQAKQLLCVWDILGKSGEVYNAALDYALAMTREGVDFEIKPYLDERVAMEDFRTGQCAGMLVTGFRARPFNQISGSIDSMGASTVVKDGHIDMPGSYEVLRKVIQAFASPQASKLMQEGAYEVGGILPVGAVYPMLRDRTTTAVDSLGGRRIGVFDNDKAQGVLVQQLGAQAVSVDISNVGSKFNNGLVDLIYLPAVTYKPFELAKGMGTKGAVVRVPVMFPTLQLIFQRQAVTEAAALKSRQYWAAQFDQVLTVVNKAESEIPASAWMNLPTASLLPYVQALREGRLIGVAQGIYHPRTLNLLKKARCGVSPAQAECATLTEVN